MMDSRVLFLSGSIGCMTVVGLLTHCRLQGGSMAHTLLRSSRIAAGAVVGKRNEAVAGVLLLLTPLTICEGSGMFDPFLCPT